MLNDLTPEEYALVQTELRHMDSPHAAYYNYTKAVEGYFAEIVHCKEIAIDVEDGVSLDETSAMNSLLRAGAFYKVANCSKSRFGSEEPIISADSTYSVGNIQIVDGELKGDIRMAKREARKISNSLTYDWDFRLYEISVYAMTLMQSMSREEEAA